jgi:RNA polymerase sigma-70 factor, ECF subfamily
MTERSLVEQARDGDATAAAELFERHWPRAWRIAFAVTGNRSLADDAAQVALIRAFASLRTFDAERPLRPWLDRIVTRSAIDHLRRSARSPVLRAEPPEPSSAGDLDDGSGLAEHVGVAVLELEPDRRLVVVLRYWVDLGIDEIASLLDLPAGTVASRLSRALAELRTTIEVGSHERRAL